MWIGAAACAAPAAADTESDTQQWTTLKINHPIGDRWAVSLWSQVRFDDDVSDYNSVHIRPAVHLAVAPRWHLGVGYNYWDKHKSDDEHWAWQEVSFAQPFGKLALGHRLKLEERFIGDISGVVWRTRYRLHAAHPLGNSRWNLLGAEDVFGRRGVTCAGTRKSAPDRIAATTSSR